MLDFVQPAGARGRGLAQLMGAVPALAQGQKSERARVKREAEGDWAALNDSNYF